jgi:lysophospholipase L1-like esterase
MGSAAAWWWRGAAVVGAVLVLLGLSFAVASPGTVSSFGAAEPTSEPVPEPAAVVPISPEERPTFEATTPVIPIEERPVAAFLGDSITRGMSDPDFGVGEHSWFYGLLDDTYGVVRWGGTTAENGITTAQMVGLVWDALYPTPDLLIVHGGTNDVSGEITPPVVVNNLERIRVAAASVGVPLAVCTLPPRAEPAADARVLAVNEAIAYWAAANDVTVLDTGSVLRDPTVGGWIPGYSADGLHPTPVAAYLMSRVAAETLRNIPLGV